MAASKQYPRPVLEELSQLRVKVAELEQRLINSSSFSDTITYKEPLFYQTLLENLPNGFIFVFDRDLRYIMVEGSTLQMPRETFEGKLVKDLVSPDNYELVVHHYNLALQGQESFFEIKFLEKTFLTRVKPLHDRLGNIVAGLSMVQDITKQKQVEEKLRESEARYRIVSEMTSDFVWAASIKPTGEYTLDWATDGMEVITGYSPQEYMELKGITGIIVPEDLSEIAALRRQIFDGKENSVEFECRIIRKDKQLRYLHITSYSIRNSNEEVYTLIAAAKDITQQKEIEAQRQAMERQFQNVEKLESLGILAGRLAHDFNNLLSVVLGNISLAQATLNSAEVKSEVINGLKDAEKASLRAVGLTQQLLTFAKGGAPIRKTARLHEIIEDSARFMISGSHVILDLQIEPTLAMAEVDADQLSQVIQNLVINAVQAMPDGGRIELTARNITLRTGEVATLQGGSYIQIRVQDEGTGITAQNLAKIFDPFFTTKANGSGLGLATVFSIIRQHEGHVEVQSEVGKGACFTFYLPASSHQPQQKTPLTMVEVSLTSTARILIMDDEPSILRTTSHLLTHLGYSCQIAADGIEALRLYREALVNNQPFAVVILDLTVANGMGGKDAAYQILKDDPKAKVIVSSGYYNDPIMANFRQYGLSGIVTKPYRLKELQQVIVEVIGQTQPSL